MIGFVKVVPAALEAPAAMRAMIAPAGMQVYEPVKRARQLRHCLSATAVTERGMGRGPSDDQRQERKENLLLAAVARPTPASAVVRDGDGRKGRIRMLDIEFAGFVL